MKITANNVALLEVSMNVGLADKNAQGHLISWRFACGQPKQPHFTGICLNLFKNRREALIQMDLLQSSSLHPRCNAGFILSMCVGLDVII